MLLAGLVVAEIALHNFDAKAVGAYLTKKGLSMMGRIKDHLNGNTTRNMRILGRPPRKYELKTRSILVDLPIGPILDVENVPSPSSSLGQVRRLQLNTQAAHAEMRSRFIPKLFFRSFG